MAILTFTTSQAEQPLSTLLPGIVNGSDVVITVVTAPVAGDAAVDVNGANGGGGGGFFRGTLTAVDSALLASVVIGGTSEFIYDGRGQVRGVNASGQTGGTNDTSELTLDIENNGGSGGQGFIDGGGGGGGGNGTATGAGQNGVAPETNLGGAGGLDGGGGTGGGNGGNINVNGQAATNGGGGGGGGNTGTGGAATTTGTARPYITVEYTAAEAAPPTAQATNVIASNLGATSVTLSCTQGNGAKRMFCVKAASSGDLTNIPVDGVTYTPSTVFGSGSDLAGWKCVALGTATTVNITGLTMGTVYRGCVVELNGDPGSELYMSGNHTGNPVSFTTDTLTPSAPQPIEAIVPGEQVTNIPGSNPIYSGLRRGG